MVTARTSPVSLPVGFFALLPPWARLCREHISIAAKDAYDKTSPERSSSRPTYCHHQYGSFHLLLTCH